jgi:tetratricopeptide (TPR) repeat protein
MLRQRSAQALILLAIIGLIVTPPVLTGYVELQRAQSALKTNTISSAAHAYERAAQFLPWEAGLWEQAGQLRFKLGEFADAIALLEKARQSGALSASGWEILGISYWQQTGDLEIAVQAWKSGLEIYPSFSNFNARLAIAYFEQQNDPAERAALERWVAADGRDDARARYRLGQLLAVSDPDRALQEVLASASLDLEYEAVVETLSTAFNLAALEPDEASKLVIIGRGLGLVGEWQLAQAAFHQAVAADGENAEAWAWLGEAKQQLGREGRAELDQALFLGRANPIVRSLRGLYWIRQDRGDQALAEYLLAAEYDPDNPVWQISIGQAYAVRGDLQAALAAYFRATEMDPTDADIWLALATFSARYNLQVEDVGLPAAQRAVDLSGDDPLALDALGWALALLERYDEAQTTLEQALASNPELAQGHLHLGIVQMQVDEWESAADRLRKALQLDRDGPVGKQAQLLLDQYFP